MGIYSPITKSQSPMLRGKSQVPTENNFTPIPFSPHVSGQNKKIEGQGNVEQGTYNNAHQSSKEFKEPTNNY